MSDFECPNIEGCKLVNSSESMDNDQKNYYLQSFCRGNNPGYAKCQRYIVKDTLFFCPDFLLPDTDMTIDEVLDRIESEE